MPSSHTFKRQRIRVAVLLAAGAVVCSGGVLASAGTAEAAVCAPKDHQGVVRCDDGSVQYIDSRGHLIIKDKTGRVVRDLPPNTPWY